MPTQPNGQGGEKFRIERTGLEANLPFGSGSGRPGMSVRAEPLPE